MNGSNGIIAPLFDVIRTLYHYKSGPKCTTFDSESGAGGAANAVDPTQVWTPWKPLVSRNFLASLTVSLSRWAILSDEFSDIVNEIVNFRDNSFKWSRWK